MDKPRATPHAPSPTITVALIAANLLAFIAAVLSGADAISPTPTELLERGGNLAPLTLGDEPWRLVTSMFLHGGILHLAMNLLGLWFTGPAAESMYGRARFAAVYGIAGLAGAVLSAARHGNTVSVGASGALFGIIGAIAAFLIAHRARIRPEIFDRQLRSIGTILLLNVVFGLSAKGIDMSAHIGGLAGGFVVGLGFEWGRAPGQRSLARTALVTVAGLAVCTATLIALPSPPPLLPEGDRVAYNQLVDVDGASHAVFKGLVADMKSGKLTDAAAAAALEPQVKPWLELQAKVHALPPPPARWQPFRAALVEYVDARVEYWTAMLAALRGGGDLEAVKQLDVRVGAALERLEAEQRRAQ